MIKKDIAERVAYELNLNYVKASSIVDTIIDSIKQAVHKHGRLEIRNFGIFLIKQRKSRIGRNPRDGKEYPIAARKNVTFQLGKELKDFSVSSRRAGKSARRRR